MRRTLNLPDAPGVWLAKYPMAPFLWVEHIFRDRNGDLGYYDDECNWRSVEKLVDDYYDHGMKWQGPIEWEQDPDPC